MVRIATVWKSFYHGPIIRPMRTVGLVCLTVTLVTLWTLSPRLHNLQTSIMLGHVTNRTKHPARDTLAECSQPASHVYFLKVFKCGSTTMQALLDRYAMSHGLWHTEFHHTHPFPDPDMIHYAQRSGTGENNIINAHMIFNEAHIRQMMPSTTKIVTIIREPFQRFKSAFKFFSLCKKFKLSTCDQQRAVEIFLENPSLYDKLYTIAYCCNGKPMNKKRTYYSHSATKNVIASQFGAHKKMEASPSDFEVDDWIEYLDDRFHFVGILEHMTASLVYMRRLLCWSVKDVITLKLRDSSQHLPANVGPATTTTKPAAGNGEQSAHNGPPRQQQQQSSHNQPGDQPGNQSSKSRNPPENQPSGQPGDQRKHSTRKQHTPSTTTNKTSNQNKNQPSNTPSSQSINQSGSISQQVLNNETVKSNQSLQQLHRLWSPLDYKVYDYFLNKFTILIETLGAEFKAECAAFDNISSKIEQFCASLCPRVLTLQKIGNSRQAISVLKELRNITFSASAEEGHNTLSKEYQDVTVTGEECLYMMINPDLLRRLNQTDHCDMETCPDLIMGHVPPKSLKSTGLLGCGSK